MIPTILLVCLYISLFIAIVKLKSLEDIEDDDKCDYELKNRHIQTINRIITFLFVNSMLVFLIFHESISAYVGMLIKAGV